MIKFLKIRDVKDPQREMGNAGVDFFVPAFTDKFKEDFETKNNEENAYISDDVCITIPPHGRALIPSGLKLRIELPNEPCINIGVDLVFENKSGVSSKKGLDVMACEVDENYQGEIHISLCNTTNDFVDIYPNDKIVQAVPRIYLNEKIQVVENVKEDEFYKDFKWTNRGDGGFGSTDKK